MTEAHDEEVVGICRDLIRIDTTNTGDTATSAGERVAAEYVAAQLAEVGLEPVIRESARGRTSVVARFPGRRPGGSAVTRGAARARPPRRGAGRPGRVERAPVLGRDPRRLPLGPRRGRHEGLRRDGAGRGASDAPGGPHAAARPGARLPRRRGGRRRVRRALAGRATTPTCSRGAPRRSARSAASPTRWPRTCGSTSSRRPRRA